jgi:hypothetical protein
LPFWLQAGKKINGGIGDEMQCPICKKDFTLKHDRKHLRKFGKCPECKFKELHGRGFGDNPPSVAIRTLETRQGMKIVLVKGERVRDTLDINFTMGGHPLIYSYVPKGEVWIDDVLGKKDREATIQHELKEYFEMKKGKSYEESHDIANAKEKAVRKKIKANPPECCGQSLQNLGTGALRLNPDAERFQLYHCLVCGRVYRDKV